MNPESVDNNNKKPGGRTTLITSLIKRYFIIRSAAVVELNDGEAFTLISRHYKKIPHHLP